MAMHFITIISKHQGVKCICSVPSISSAFHLGYSPVRRVYDSDATDTHGLLEVKCPSVSSITECKYLVKDGATDNLHLKKTLEYYYQVQEQMGLTGASRCDFYV